MWARCPIRLSTALLTGSTHPVHSSTIGRRTSYVELTDAAIDAHLEHGPKVPVVNSTVHIYPINGACHRVAADETAFAYRDATFATVTSTAGMWPDAADNDANVNGSGTTTTRWLLSPRKGAT